MWSVGNTCLDLTIMSYLHIYLWSLKLLSSSLGLASAESTARRFQCINQLRHYLVCNPVQVSNGNIDSCPETYIEFYWDEQLTTSDEGLLRGPSREIDRGIQSDTQGCYAIFASWVVVLKETVQYKRGAAVTINNKSMIQLSLLSLV